MTQEKQNFEADKKQEILHDIKRCELIFKPETVLDYQTDIHDTVLKEYLSNNRKFQFQKYSVDECRDHNKEATEKKLKLKILKVCLL